MIVVVAFEFRTTGRFNFPKDGSAVFLSSHQSFLDPVLIGLSFNGRLNYIARKTLFHQPIFAFLIRLLDAIEIDRERGGLAGLREMLKRLHNGKMVLIFPEGTRTADGRIGKIKLGFAPIARKTKTTLIPMSISGAIDVLPRTSIFPGRHPIALVVGRPISSDEVATLDDQQLQGLLIKLLENCKAEADFLKSIRG